MTPDLLRPAGAALDWLLTEFVRATPGVLASIVVSADGMPVATSPGVGDALGDQLSAATCGLVSLARGTAQLLGGGRMSQTIVEMAEGYLFVTTIGEGTALATHAERACDMGLVGYEMALLASRVGHALTPAVRTGHVHR